MRPHLSRSRYEQARRPSSVRPPIRVASFYRAARGSAARRLSSFRCRHSSIDRDSRWAAAALSRPERTDTRQRSACTESRRRTPCGSGSSPSQGVFANCEWRSRLACNSACPRDPLTCLTICRVRRPRQIAAAVLFSATLVGSAWLYLYRVPNVATFIDQRGYVYHQPYTVSVQPWWSVFAAVLLLAVGAVAAISVMPGRARVKARLAHFMSASAHVGGRASSARVATGLALVAVRVVVSGTARVTARAAHSLRVTHPLG